MDLDHDIDAEDIAYLDRAHGIDALLLAAEEAEKNLLDAESTKE
jgi:hypothetical protein